MAAAILVSRAGGYVRLSNVHTKPASAWSQCLTTPVACRTTVGLIQSISDRTEHVHGLKTGVAASPTPREPKTAT